MEQPPEKVIETITAIEEMAEDVLADRRQMIELDRKRQKMREAARYLLGNRMLRICDTAFIVSLQTYLNCHCILYVNW